MVMRSRLLFCLFPLTLLVLPCHGQPRGHLFIIGGGDRSPEMMRQFVALAGGPGAARIVVVPNASSVPETSGIEQAAEFRQLGVRSAEVLWLTRAAA